MLAGIAGCRLAPSQSRFAHAQKSRDARQAFSGRAKGVVAQFHRGAIVRLQHGQSHGVRLPMIQQGFNRAEVAHRLSHLLAFHIHHGAMHPPLRETMTGSLGLG